MFLKQIDPAHIAPERVERLVAADLGELSDRGARFRRLM
jgi:hypothetical protein